jgi:cytochrome c-type biogenesis protein CcmE
MRKRYLIGGGILLVAVALLIYAGVQCFGVYMVSVDEFLAGDDIDYDSSVRVAGQVADDSISWDAESLELRFTVTYESASMPVLYRGARPSGLQDGSGVVVEGKYRPSGVFEADQIILKCSSKYEVLE